MIILKPTRRASGDKPEQREITHVAQRVSFGVSSRDQWLVDIIALGAALHRLKIGETR